LTVWLNLTKQINVETSCLVFYPKPNIKLKPVGFAML
jgi:hypothetical protein